MFVSRPTLSIRFFSTKPEGGSLDPVKYCLRVDMGPRDLSRCVFDMKANMAILADALLDGLPSRVAVSFTIEVVRSDRPSLNVNSVGLEVNGEGPKGYYPRELVGAEGLTYWAKDSSPAENLALRLEESVTESFTHYGREKSKGVFL